MRARDAIDCAVKAPFARRRRIPVVGGERSLPLRTGRQSASALAAFASIASVDAALPPAPKSGHAGVRRRVPQAVRFQQPGRPDYGCSRDRSASGAFVSTARTSWLLPRERASRLMSAISPRALCLRS